MKVKKDRFQQPRAIFQRAGGIMRTGQAIRAGIHPRTLYEMREAGMVERLSRGVYRLADLPPLSDPDLVSVSIRAPESVICLISALAFHGLTTQIPHQIYIAVERRSRIPKIDYPPVRVVRFSPKAFRAGVELYRVDKVTIRVYGPEKTVADCFKYRNKIGLDTAVEALKLYRRRRRAKMDELLQFARVCRVYNIMRPYLEALV